MIKNNLVNNLIKKASQSNCAYKVSAIAFTKKGNLLGYSFNKHRFTNKGGGLHAERLLFERYGSKIDTIYIIRVNRNKEELPIEACYTCQKIAKKMKVKIINIGV